MSGNLKRLLTLALPFKWWMLSAAVLGFFTVSSGVGLMMTSAYIIARAALHPSVAELQVAIVGVRFFGLSRGIFRYLERLVAHHVTFRLLAQFRVWFFQAIEPLAPARLAHLKSGDLLARVVSDVDTLQNFYIRVLAPPFVALLVSLMMFIVFGFFSWSFALILFVFMLLAAVVVPLLTLTTTRGFGARLVMLESELSVLSLEGVQGLADLMVFGQASAHFARFAELSDELIHLKRRQKVTLALHESFIGLLMNGAVAALFFSAVPRVNSGSLEGVYLAVLALGIMAAFEAVLPLPAAALFLEEIDRAAKRLFEITDVPLPVMPARPFPEEPVDFSIEFENVTFRYAPDEPPVLTNFSLRIPHGGKVVIRGPSGVGKSTLTNLLLRFRDVQEGQVVIGGRSIEQWTPQQLTDLISLAPQQVFLFSGSILENLLLAKPEASIDEIVQACCMAKLHEFVAALPDGYDTLIGEGGLRLSGGERRRLSIARALLKKTPILLLDEPMADVDAVTEAALWAMIAELPAMQTVVVIAHGTADNRFQLFDLEKLINRS